MEKFEGELIRTSLEIPLSIYQEIKNNGQSIKGVFMRGYQALLDQALLRRDIADKEAVIVRQNIRYETMQKLLLEKERGV